MDPVGVIEAFKTYLRESAARMLQSGAGPSEFRDDSGLTVVGWQYDYLALERVEEYNENFRPYYRGGHWGDMTFLLSTDGELHEKVFRGEDVLNGRDEIVTSLTTRVSPTPLRSVIGPGEPFVDVKRKIDAMVLRAYAR